MSDLPAPNRARICRADESVLIVIDIQQGLGEAMPGKVLNRVLFNAVLLARSADLLGIPVLQTEQYPRGLGNTHPDVTKAIPASAQRFEKTSFSCCMVPGLPAVLDRLGRQQVVIVGMESHVCVLQSALDLSAAGLDVFVAEDAICSRRLENYQNALDRMRQSDISIVSAESVVFEWMGDATHEHFKSIQALLR